MNRGGYFSNIYKRDHFVDSFTGEAAFLEGRIARPRRHSLAMATFFMVQRRQACNSLELRLIVDALDDTHQFPLQSGKGRVDVVNTRTSLIKIPRSAS
jgi:hypothetical protein